MFWRTGSKRAEQLPGAILTCALPSLADAKQQTAGDPRATQL